MRDPKRLLGGHATDSLTSAERQELLRAALDDQEVFDSLVEDEGLRELLAIPDARREVLEALEAPTGRERFRQWFARPALVADLVLIAHVLILGTVGLRVYRGLDASDVPLPAARSPMREMSAAALARLYSLPPQRPRPVALEPVGEPATPWRVSPGATLAVKASGPAPARLLLVGEGEDGQVVQLFPPPGRDALLVGARPGDTRATRVIEITASRRPGPHRLRLVAMPPSYPLDVVPPDDLARLGDIVSLVDLTYEVAP